MNRVAVLIGIGLWKFVRKGIHVHYQERLLLIEVLEYIELPSFQRFCNRNELMSIELVILLILNHIFVYLDRFIIVATFVLCIL